MNQKHRHPSLVSPSGSRSVAREDVGWSALIGMGAAIAAVLVLGLVVGWLVDRLASTSPIFLLVGLTFGVVGACTYTITQFRRYMSE